MMTRPLVAPEFAPESDDYVNRFSSPYWRMDDEEGELEAAPSTPRGGSGTRTSKRPRSEESEEGGNNKRDSKRRHTAGSAGSGGDTANADDKGSTGSGEDRRRRWNRDNARKSRVRKKMLVQTMQERLDRLRHETQDIRSIIHRSGLQSDWESWAQSNAPDFVHPSAPLVAGVVSSEEGTVPAKSPFPTTGFVPREGGEVGEGPLFSSGASASRGTVRLRNDDFALMQSVHVCQRHFLITDPLAPDNPIVFASHGFFDLTGYTPDEVIGRNCRMLQGPASDPDAVAELRRAVDEGDDTHVVLLNYRKDGSAFWNDLFLAPLRDPHGRVVHFLGVQSSVSEARARELLRLKRAAKRCEQAGKEAGAQLERIQAGMRTRIQNRAHLWQRGRAGKDDDGAGNGESN